MKKSFFGKELMMEFVKKQTTWMSRAIVLLLASVVLCGSLVFLTGDAGAEGPANYDYDSLYVDGGLVLSYDAFTHKEGDTVESTLATSSDGQYALNLSALSGDTLSAAYGNGYLEMNVGMQLSASNVLTLADETTPEKNYTVEYLFANVDKGLPSEGTPLTSSAYAQWMYPSVSRQIVPFRIGALTIKTNFAPSETIRFLRAERDRYQRALNSTTAAAEYTFVANQAHMPEGATSLNFEQTQSLLAGSNSSYYAFLNYDFDQIFGSNIAKTVVFAYDGGASNAWAKDADWRPSDMKLLAQPFEDVNRLTFTIKNTYKLVNDTYQYGVSSVIYKNNNTLLTVSERTTASKNSSADDLWLSRDMGARVYAVRVYDRELTEDERAQNHLADVYKFYQIDPTPYLTANDAMRPLLLSAAATVDVGETSREEAVEIMNNALRNVSLTVENEYTKLYVQDGLIFMINPMTTDLPEAGSTINAISDLSGRFWNGTGATQRKAVERGVNLGWGGGIIIDGVVPAQDTHTVQLTFAWSDDNNPKVRHHSKTAFHIGSLEYRICYMPPEIDDSYHHIADIEKALVFAYPGDGSTIKWLRDFDTVWNNGRDKQPDLFAEPYGRIMEFTSAVESASGKMNLSIFKDSKLVTESSFVGGEKLLGRLSLGHVAGNLDLYGLLVYNRTLTEAEMLQNHFANLMSYYQIDLTQFEMMDEEVKVKLYALLAEEQVGQSNRTYLQNALDIYAYTGGDLGVIAAEDYVTFEGVQAHIDDYASIRALFSIDDASLAELESKGCMVEYGVLLANKADCASKDDLTVIRNNALGEYTVANKKVKKIATYRYGEHISDSEALISRRDGKTYIAATVDPVALGSLTNEWLMSEYYARTYLAVDMQGIIFYFYADASGDLFGESFSPYEASSHFLFNGYADAPALTESCGKHMTAAAQAVKEMTADAEKKLSNAELANLIAVSAYEGALLAKEENDLAGSKISITMSQGDGMAYGVRAATSKTQALLYSQFAIGKYDMADADSKFVQTLLQTITADAKTAALAAGADEDTANDIAAVSVKSLAPRLEKVLSDLVKVSPTVVKLRGYEDLYINSYTVDNRLSKVFPSICNLVINGKNIRNYNIITDTEHLEVAQKLQKILLAKFSAPAGIYNMDNEYVGDLYDYKADYSIVLGLTDEWLKEDDGYAVYGEGSCIYIEGASLESLEVGVVKFLNTFCGASGRANVTIDRAENSVAFAEYVPIYTPDNDIGDKAVVKTTFDAQGVFDIFMQKVAEIPEEITTAPLRYPADDLPDHRTIYVAKDGNDAAKGTIDDPLASMEAAVSKLAWNGGGRIYIRGGTYTLTSTVQMDERMSGLPTSPMYIAAYPGEEVIFTAGSVLDSTAFKKVGEAIAAGELDESIRTKLNTFTADNANNVYVANLYDMGLTEDFLGTVNTSNEPSLYVGEDTYELSRYPNAGAKDTALGISNGRIPLSDKGRPEDLGIDDVLVVGKVSNDASSLYEKHKNDSGSWTICFDNAVYKDRILKYSESSEQLMAFAAVYQEWWRERYDITLSVDSQGRNVMKTDRICQWGAIESSGNNLFFYNIIEELDTDKEYFLDREGGNLYVWSSKALAGEKIVLCAKSVNLFTLQGVSDIVFDGITFERSMGSGITCNLCDNVLVQNCTFRQFGGHGLSYNKTKESGALYSDFSACTSSMVNFYWAGGLAEPSFNYVQNCTFHDPHVLNQTGLSYTGCRDVYSHNKFVHCTISCGGHENIIEYNEFDGGSQVTHDSGPIYMSGAGKRGNHVRYNLFHDLNVSRYGIYLDDFSCGNYVYYNIVHYAEENSGSGRCINIHSGNMNVLYNNIGINAGLAGFKDDLNYYVQTINGQGTGGGGLSYRWPGFISSYYKTAQNMVGETYEHYNKRFPLYANEYNDLMLEHGYIFENDPTWTHGKKNSIKDKAEIFIRSSPFNCYVNNVMVACERPWAISSVGMSTALFEGNKAYATIEEAGFVDIANGNFALASDSPIYEAIPEFHKIPVEKIGLQNK